MAGETGNCGRDEDDLLLHNAQSSPIIGVYVGALRASTWNCFYCPLLAGFFDNKCYRKLNMLMTDFTETHRTETRQYRHPTVKKHGHQWHSYQYSNYSEDYIISMLLYKHISVLTLTKTYAYNICEVIFQSVSLLPKVAIISRNL
jgi:hypothetical protein